MSYKVTKTEVANMSEEKLVKAHEMCITVWTQEVVYGKGGETKTTLNSRKLLQEELLRRLGGTDNV